MNSEISTAEQVKALAQKRLEIEDAAAPVETVTLPSGLVFLLQRPRPLWWALHERLPSSMAAKVAGNTAPAGASKPEEAVDLAQWLVALLGEMVLQPKIRMNPAEGEADPNWLSQEDVLFLIRYAGGEIEADGQSLDRFSGVGQPAAAGTGSAVVELPPLGDVAATGSSGAPN